MDDADQRRHDRFLRLFLREEESLRGFVRSLVRTREDARDVMQDVAAVLWRKFDALVSDDDFRRWAFGVARLEALAAARDRARDRHVFGDDLLRLLADEAQQAADGHAARRRALERCLEKLPTSQRELLRAAYAEGTHIGRLAGDLGRTAMSLYKSLHRIRVQLVACVRREAAREGAA